MHWSNKLEAVRRVVGDIHSSLIQVVTLLCPEETAKTFLNKQVQSQTPLQLLSEYRSIRVASVLPDLQATPPRYSALSREGERCRSNGDDID